jgi:hypothetical protein
VSDNIDFLNTFFRALSFYKGILPPLLAETPKRAVKFFTFEQYKSMYSYGWIYYVLLSNMYWLILFKISRTFLLIERG